VLPDLFPAEDAAGEPLVDAALGAPTGAELAPVPVADRGRDIVLAVAVLVVGAVATTLGTAVVQSAPMAARVVLVAGGAVAILRGVALALRAAFGPTFDATKWFALSWLGLVVLTAISAPLLPLSEHADTSATLANAPFVRPDLVSDHPLGTNNFGLDLLARVVYGARASLAVSLIAVAVGIVVGGLIGVVSGYWRGPLDRGIGVLNNTLLAFPPLVLLLALSSVLDPNVRTLAIGLSILSIPINVRLARAATIQVAQREFVQAARAMGATRRRIVVHELIPSVLPTLLSYGMIVVAVMIVAEASLSFLGLGIKQPNPSWGNMIAEGQQGIFEANPHIVLVPGIVLFLTVFSFNLLGERFQSRWDPRRASR
jgi:peptide/nickel transport system permease protein